MTAKRVPIVCHGHQRPIVDLNFSPVTAEGYFLASASKDGLPMLRFGDTGDWYGTFQGHKGAVWSCCLDDSALRAATGSADFTARLWDACTGDQLHEFQHKHIVRTLQFGHNNNKLATGGHEKLIRIYDLGKPTEDPFCLPQTPDTIRCLSWVQDDTLLLCSFPDRDGVSVYDVRTGEAVSKLQTSAPVTSVEVSYCQKFITTADGKTVKVWDASSLGLVAEHTLKQKIESASFCPSKRKFVAGGEDMWARLFDFDTGQELECNKGHHGPIHNIRFSPTYESYASGSEDGTIRIWFLNDDQPGEGNCDANHVDQNT